MRIVRAPVYMFYAIRTCNMAAFKLCIKCVYALGSPLSHPRHTSSHLIPLGCISATKKKHPDNTHTKQTKKIAHFSFSKPHIWPSIPISNSHPPPPPNPRRPHNATAACNIISFRAELSHAYTHQQDSSPHSRPMLVDPQQRHPKSVVDQPACQTNTLSLSGNLAAVLPKRRSPRVCLCVLTNLCFCACVCVCA